MVYFVKNANTKKSAHSLITTIFDLFHVQIRNFGVTHEFVRTFFRDVRGFDYILWTC